MYESHFGLRAPPFQLSPDPAFYFGSQGHSHALAYLKYGVYQGEGFIVVTGDIGAGKTTLVRTLLRSVDSSRVIAAQITNTQLDAGELLRAVALAFGVPLRQTSKAEMIATLEAFFVAVAAKGRRALLVIDEAQNLGLHEVEELRMLSNFQIGNHLLLQSFLVGQPELRQKLLSPAMEQLRQRVIASCHLGPLTAAETRDYVEHRLRRVGWQDNPHFEESSFRAIHAETTGIPRRINVLCSRLLLTAFIESLRVIDGALVNSVSGNLNAELGLTLPSRV